MKNLSMPAGPADHTLGPKTAAITLVEYGKYDCSHCARAVSVIAELRERFPGPLRYVYRHFPGGNPVSERAAQAAEAAGSQGKFWEMHALLLENHQALDDANLIAYAEMLGLDTKRFARELASGAHEEKVRTQLRSGLDSGVHGTPTFYINGMRHDDFWDVDTLLAAFRTSTVPAAA